jgi:hypothetical protein
VGCAGEWIRIRPRGDGDKGRRRGNKKRKNKKEKIKENKREKEGNKKRRVLWTFHSSHSEKKSFCQTFLQNGLSFITESAPLVQPQLELPQPQSPAVCTLQRRKLQGKRTRPHRVTGETTSVDRGRCCVGPRRRACFGVAARASVGGAAFATVACTSSACWLPPCFRSE